MTTDSRLHPGVGGDRDTIGCRGARPLGGHRRRRTDEGGGGQRVRATGPGHREAQLRRIDDLAPTQLRAGGAARERLGQQRHHVAELDLPQHLGHVGEMRALGAARNVDVGVGAGLHIATLDVGHPQPRIVREGVAGRNGESLRLAHEWLVIETRGVERFDDDRHVGVTGTQQPGLLAPAGERDLDGNRRVLSAVHREHILQQAAFDIRFHGEDQWTVRGVRPSSGTVRRGVECEECVSHIPEQRCTRLGEDDMPGRALEQANPEFGLESGDGAGQGGRRDAHPLGGPREVEFFGDRNEVAQRPRLHLIHTFRVMTRSEPVLLIVTPPRQHRIMIVITTPTGTIGAAVAESLNAAGQALRLIVRDPAKLPPRLTQHAEVVVGSHNDPAVLDQALTGADALFVVVPPDFRADDVTEYYLGFARPIADAVRVHEVPRVVAVSSLGRGFTQPAGMLSAAWAMDDVLESSGAAYRSLQAAFFMENLLHQRDSITKGTFTMTADPDSEVATVACSDIADAAATLLSDATWTGSQGIPIRDPHDHTPRQLGQIMSEPLRRSVVYRQSTFAEYRESYAAHGASPATVQGLVEMAEAQAAGVYPPADGTGNGTTFAEWCATVLTRAVTAPAASR